MPTTGCSRAARALLDSCCRTASVTRHRATAPRPGGRLAGGVGDRSAARHCGAATGSAAPAAGSPAARTSALAALGIEGRQVEGADFTPLIEGRHPRTCEWSRRAGAGGGRGRPVRRRPSATHHRRGSGEHQARLRPARASRAQGATVGRALVVRSGWPAARNNQCPLHAGRDGDRPRMLSARRRGRVEGRAARAPSRPAGRSRRSHASRRRAAGSVRSP